MSSTDKPLTARIVEAFVTGHLSPLLLLLAMAAGAFALWVTPREEEPQIVVPIADVLVDVPGASAAEVERLVATRLEKLLMQIDGVEYVYSASRAHQAIVSVRFFVGEDREQSLVKLHTKLQMHAAEIPPQVTRWIVRPVDVDDVPILCLTLWSETLPDTVLRRCAEELERRVQTAPDVGRTQVVGGAPRRILVEPDVEALRAHGLAFDEVERALQAASTSRPGGVLELQDRRLVLESASIPADTKVLGELVVGVHQGRPVRLLEVATVRDGHAERTSYVRYSRARQADDHAAVTLAVGKRKGSNAVHVAAAAQERFAAAAQELLPAEVHWQVTRDHGHTADAKVTELLEGLFVAIVIVVALIALSLGWREGFVVVTAVPITFALTLLVNWLAGYSINRVTLFALILALGLVVDDPIVDVENIHRHLRKGGKSRLQAVLDAVNEVRPPVILATLAVIVSFLPLFFITGMMGPYMAPMALNVPLAMLMSLLVAFTITPWLSNLMLRGHAHGTEVAAAPPRGVLAGYAATMRLLLRARGLRWTVLGATALAFAGACWLAIDRRVPLKMLPYDNKNELQVVVDLPEGTSLERTEAAVAELAASIRGMPEAVDVTSYVGTASPIDFNGLVRHHEMRQEPHQADLRLNLLDKRARSAQSHAIALRLRGQLQPIAARHQAVLQVVEAPPGPPVLATLTVEVYGADQLEYAALERAALTVRDRLAQEAGVVDVDTTVPAPQQQSRYVLDRAKAALHGIGDGLAAARLHDAVQGRAIAALHAPRELAPLAVELRLPRARRTGTSDLDQLALRGANGELVALAELGAFHTERVESTIHHKNLRRVVYVFAEVAGRAPAEVILDVQADRGRTQAAPVPVAARNFVRNGAGIPWQVPETIELSWTGEGEWKITLDAFRDLGLAFFAACFGIYVLLVHETRSYVLPLILMLAIPFTILGIMPGFWLLGLFGGTVDGYRDQTFFTATAMIGMIALAGITVRNSILLIEFLHGEEKRGRPLAEAVVASGLVRLRPILLTAGTALLAAVPITLDPVFSGLAWALIFGLVVSSAFTLLLVPLVYAMVYGGKRPAVVEPTLP